MKVRDYLIIVLGVLLVATTIGAIGKDRALERVTAEAKRARANELRERTRADGFLAEFGRQQNDWLDLRAQKDSQIAALNRAVAAAEAHALSLTQVELSAKGQGTTPARFDSVPVLAPQLRAENVHTDSIARAHIEDGPLNLAVSYNLPTQVFGWSWQAKMAAEFFHTITPDNRLLVNARSLDPRVTVQIPEFVYELPREQKRGFPWKATGLAALGGFSVCAVAK